MLIENFKLGGLQKLGLGYEDLHREQPRLVYCSITGYGQTGPYAERPGHDLNYVALSGLLAADRPDPTMLPRMFIADVGGGAMSAVLAPTVSAVDG